VPDLAGDEGGVLQVDDLGDVARLAHPADRVQAARNSTFSY
jgi:hypothetical protein